MSLCKKPNKEEKEDIDIFYKTDNTYEITINPSDKHQFKGRVNRFILFYQNIYDRLRGSLGLSCDYELYIELSEPRNSNEKKAVFPRLHLHGTITIRSVFTFLEETLIKLMKVSDYSINLYRPDYWKKYCMKQQDIIRPMLKKYTLPDVLTNKDITLKRVDMKTGEVARGEPPAKSLFSNWYREQSSSDSEDGLDHNIKK